MWVMTEDGMFSAVVSKDDPDDLVVRTRAKADADFLVKWLWDEHGVDTEIVIPDRVTDYPWRVIMSRELWGSYLVYATEMAEYGNFKSRIGEVNPARAKVYSDVWAVLLRVEDEDETPAQRAAKAARAVKARRVGLWDELLRDPNEGRERTSFHDLTEDEWQLLMEEPPAPPRQRRKKKGKARR